MRRVSEPDILEQASHAMARAMTVSACKPAGAMHICKARRARATRRPVRIEDHFTKQIEIGKAEQYLEKKENWTLKCSKQLRLSRAIMVKY